MESVVLLKRIVFWNVLNDDHRGEISPNELQVLHLFFPVVGQVLVVESVGDEVFRVDVIEYLVCVHLCGRSEHNQFEVLGHVFNELQGIGPDLEGLWELFFEVVHFVVGEVDQGFIQV